MEKSEILRTYKRIEEKLKLIAILFSFLYLGMCLVLGLFVSWLLSELTSIDMEKTSYLAMIVPGLLLLGAETLHEKYKIHYCAKKLGIPYKEVKAVVKEQKEREKKWTSSELQKSRFEKDGSFYLSPFLRKLSQLNVGGRKEQEAFFVERYGRAYLHTIFGESPPDEVMNVVFQYWRKQELVDRKGLVETLFKFSVLEDGIRNNEWNLLIQWMVQLKFNANYIDYFKKRYAPLRTEFDSYERSSSSSNSTSSTYLKPYYSELGLSENATDEEIKRAYHALALEHHPDLPKNADRVKECEEKMAKINLAYEKVMG